MKGKKKVKLPNGYHVHEDGTMHSHHDGDKHSHHHHNDGHHHSHDHGDDHDHHHHEEKSHRRVIELERKVLEKNDIAAEENRMYFEKHGIVTVNIISSPGSGKTMLLEKTLDRLKGKIQCAVITGDIQTDNDARRLKGRGAKVHQIETGSSCHLNAEQVGRVLHDVIDKKTKILFIENVGNLVCPAAFDLGETFKIALLSVPEGEDKPVKYPVIFSTAKLVIITKTDLMKHLDCDIKKMRKYIREINPGVFIFELSAKTGEGMDAWIDYLTKLTE
ncbi:MAG: hydrogenase accessory protein HypB [Lentisphaerae bacterium GWF2_49_21]|nr:MAG: hydrogenase accessory protein HypB [Lentisphaerae bacterium GWF2_49_21]